MKLLPTATKVGRWGLYLGLFCGVLYSCGGLVVDLLTIGLNAGTALAFGALIGMPAVFGAIGFFVGALGALIAQGARAVLERMGN